MLSLKHGRLPFYVLTLRVFSRRPGCGAAFIKAE